MKIGFVLDDSLDKPDGVQQAVLTLGEWFSHQGHDVHYLVGHTNRTDIKNIHSLARTFRVRFNGNTMGTPLPVSGTLLKSFFANHDFDVLHVQMPYSPFFAARLIKFAPPATKIIGTFHILPYSRISSIATKQLAKLIKKSLKRFDHFISVSGPAAKFAKTSFGIDSKVIPNPVDTGNFIQLVKPDDSERRNIVFLGRLEERKGIKELIRAYGEMLSTEPAMIKKTMLHIGGRGPLRNSVREMVKSLPAGANVKLLGFVPENVKAKLLASADVAVFPSISGESFGIVLVEAMASGSRVVLAGNNPGYASVLAGRPELLLNPRDKKEFSKKLLWALKDSKEVDAVGKWLKAQALRYDVKIVGEQLLELYSS